MSYRINKEVGYAEYIKYLEDIILIVEKNLYEAQQSGLHYIDPDIYDAIDVIKENRRK